MKTPLAQVLLSLLFLILIFFIVSCSSPEKKKNFSETKWALQVEKTRVEDLYAPHERDGRFFAPSLQWIVA
jgi:hypothetical protein